MNDYIKRADVLALVKQMEKNYADEYRENEPKGREYTLVNMGSLNALTAFEDGLSDIPSTDVRPMVHGKWVKIYEDGEPAIEQHQIGVFCSKCMKIPKNRFTESEFCPNCGADMRSKGESK